MVYSEPVPCVKVQRNSRWKGGGENGAREGRAGGISIGFKKERERTLTKSILTMLNSETKYGTGGMSKGGGGKKRGKSWGAGEA